METLRKSSPYFVRCIRSNGHQRAMEFDDSLVMEQLKSSGMSETVKIKQSSDPIRIPHSRFARQFSALFGHQKTSRNKLRSYLGHLNLPPKTYAVGNNLIFLKEESKKLLDEKLENAVIDKVILLQRNVRIWLTRKHQRARRDEFRHVQERHRAATVIQAYWRGYLERLVYEDFRISAITIQSYWRTYCLRENYLKLRQSIIGIQACFKQKNLRYNNTI